MDSIEEVLGRLEAIDRSLPDEDGVKWFTRLYKLVTERVASVPKSSWEAPEWLERLDVVFATLTDGKDPGQNGNSFMTASNSADYFLSFE